MTRIVFPLPLSFFVLAFVCFGAVSAHARALTNQQDPPAATAAATTVAPQAAADDDDDDAVLQPAEPDYSLINLPTTLRLPLHKGNFHLTHRFGGNLRQGSFGEQASNLFGLDEGAIMQFEYRFAVARHVEAVTSRTNFDRTIQFSGKYDAVHQHASAPVSISAIASVEGTNNFRVNYAPAVGVVVSRMIDDAVALYAVPLYVHNSAAGSGADRDTFLVGVGGRVRVMPRMYLSAEVSPRVSGYIPGDAEYGFGVETRVGGHFFSLTFTNTTQGTTYAQLARGGFPSSLFLGFNLARKFF